MTGKKNAVYLLHFDRPLHHARHYMGAAADLDARLAQHAAGNGARLTAVVRGLGIGWTLAGAWEHPTLKAARTAESYYKKHLKNACRTLCPICTGEAPR